MKQFSDFSSPPPPYDIIANRTEQCELVDRPPRRHKSMAVPTTQQLQPLVGGSSSHYDDRNGVWVRFADADHRSHCFRLGSCSCDFPQSICCRGHGCAMSNRVFSLVIGILATIALILTGAIIGWTIVNNKS